MDFIVDKACDRLKKGFSLVELVIAVAVIAMIAAIGFASFSGYRKAVEARKLESDVSTLNRAVSAYLTNGGSLASITDIEQIIAKLKTKAASAQQEQVVGLKGAFIDPRLSAVMQTTAEASTAEPRAIWDASLLKFQIKNSGLGVKKFVLTGNPSATVEEVRDIKLKHATEDNWVWDYDEQTLPPRQTFTTLPTATVTPAAAPVPVGGVFLQPPTFSLLGGSYPLVDYSLTINLTNPNPPGVSQLVVSLNGGLFDYCPSGMVSVVPGTTVAAYTKSIDPDYWIDSTTDSHLYETTPVSLDINFAVPKLAVNYGEVGGAMIPGSSPGPAPASPGSVSLNNAGDIPLEFQNDSIFTIAWTYDGSDPATSGAKFTAPPFSGGFPGVAIDYSLPQWGSATTLPIQAVATSFNTSLVTDSPVVVKALSIDPIALRAPLITIGATSVTIEPVTDFGDTPVGARIYYTLTGTAPGDLNGVPTSGTLYTGPFSVASVKSKEIKARVYAPSGVEQWFTTSPVTSEISKTAYGDLKIALLVDESGSIDATEAAEIRAGLAQFFTDEQNSGNLISVIGMGPTDYDTRSDHIAEGEITPATKPAYDTWVSGFRTGRVSIQSDFWASALELAAKNTELDLAVIIGDGTQGNTVKMANQVSQMRANGTHVFFIGIDPGEYIYGSGNISPSPSTVIDAVLGSNASPSSQPDLSDLPTTDYAVQPTFSSLGTTLSNMTATLKAAY
ncbi:MAG: prepilin-type N-terminal cleavage/methylation domain-containing protein [Verrucomicrobiae bacterium]|nr:prepilin-type N-terminal cleavage/methylation domain-containing protein [Verrucomicrobiae bacterium]